MFLKYIKYILNNVLVNVLVLLHSAEREIEDINRKLIVNSTVNMIANITVNGIVNIIVNNIGNSIVKSKQFS